MMKRFKGNSLLEYILPMGLFFLSGIIIIVVGDVPGRISAFFTDTVDATMVGTTAEVETIGELSTEKYALQQQIMAGTVRRIGGERTSLYDRTDEICFSSGMCLNIPVISNSTVAADTAGGLGGDLAIELAGTFEQIATQLEAADIDPTITQYVTMLSRNGHDIGTLMQEVAGACEVTPCDPSPDNREIGEFRSRKMSFQNRFNVLNGYLEQHPSALDAFPEAQDIITLEAQQIMAIANGTNYDENYDTSSQSSSETVVSYDIETGNYAELVNQSANDICQQGGDTGRCVINGT